MPRSECPDCFGEGKVTEETAKKCHNCNGVGSKAAGRGSRFVCNVCEGEGELVDRAERDCPACGGTGRAGAPAQQGMGLGRIFGRGREEEQPEDDARGRRGREGGDEEAGGSAPRRPAAGARGGEEASVPRPAREKSAAGAAADAAAEVAQRGALAAFGVSGRGFHWHEGRGLEVDLFFSTRCLLTTLGSILSLIGAALTSSEITWKFILGAFLLVCGFSLNVYANYGWCLRCMQSGMVPRAVG